MSADGVAVPGRYDYCPWLYFGSATEEERARQAARRRRLQEGSEGEVELAEETYVSEWAGVFVDSLRLGRKSYIAAHAYVTGEVTTGRDCTVNPYAVVRGQVRMGDGVRIGAHSSVLGFNHSMAAERPVYKQPLTSKGIEIGDDVWIGSHVVVLDGVSIGAHSVIGAGAVVTRDLPEWSVAAGNPARRVRDRREVAGGGSRAAARSGAGAPAEDRADAELAERLTQFADRARSQAPDILARSLVDGPDGRPLFTDRPGTEPTVRAQCDAVEVSHLLLRSAPPQVPADDLGTHLRGLQDPATGLVPEYGAGPPTLDDETAMYHILSVGYALKLLDSAFAHPIRAVHELSPEHLTTRLTALPWEREAWRAGHWVDGIGTAVLRNIEDHGLRAPAADTLFGWLLTRADPWHGMWGRPTPKDRWLQPVNGFYRATRGTFAQFGLPIPYPDRVVDTVLTHAADPAFFAPTRGNACNVLDVIHPLWLAARQTTHRLEATQTWARTQLDRLLASWQDGAGLSFAGTRNAEPGLQGTEMWLAIAWYLADHLGLSENLGYRPAGVHRPHPARQG
ncbi:acyltransferase [Streptomyces boninensis]|uniref:acyltransferase n=1 Tax=Streptomyces boninensis TaxID=2039455 RepID=UPI003B227D1B